MFKFSDRKRHLVATVLCVLSVIMMGASWPTYAANKSKLSIYQHGKPVSYMPCGSKSLGKRTAVLMGGGVDVSAAFSRMIDRMTKCADGTTGRSGNFVVIRAGGNPAYDSYINKQGIVAAVVTIVVPDRESALAIGDPSNEVGQQVQGLLRTAGAIFLTGGDQGDYYNFWKGTPVEQLISTQVEQFGVPIGGTSAGMMILSEVSYIPDIAYSSSYALQNPYYMMQWLHRDFWANKPPFVPLIGTVTDSHFDTRDRMGRLLTFLADTIARGWADLSEAKAIGVDQETALVMEYSPYLVGKSGEIDVSFEVLANPGVAGAAYLITPSKGGTVNVPNSGALTFTNINVQKFLADGSSASYQISVRSGVLYPSNGSIY